MKILKYIILVIVLIITSLIIFVWQVGIFAVLSVEERTMGPYTLVYEEHVGSYNEVGPIFDQVYNQLKADGIDTVLGMGIYYDNPEDTDASLLRSDVGSLIDEVQLTVIDRQVYNVKSIDQASYAVVSMPYKNQLSYIIGAVKAYPALDEYCINHGCVQADYAIELYTPDTIYYMMPTIVQ